MSDPATEPTRRAIVGAALALAPLLTQPALAANPAKAHSAPQEGRHAFAFQTGTWRVQHRKRKQRLAGSDEWVNFMGRCSAWELLDGAANVEDQFLDDPDGAYRAAGFRRIDPATGLWSIWWFDGRSSVVEPPLTGSFADGLGTFLAEDQLNGRPITVRYLWSDVDGDAPRWEQSFSPDRGATWETNWIMQFERLS